MHAVLLIYNGGERKIDRLKEYNEMSKVADKNRLKR